MSDPIRTRDAADDRKGGALRRFGIYAGILGAVFLLGFVPMWLTARERAQNLTAAEGRLRVSGLENLVAGAALNSGRGEHEAARQQMSDFYTRLREETDRAD